MESIGLLPLGSISRISNIAPGSMIVEIPAKTDPISIDRGVNAVCEFHLSWINADGTSEDRRLTVELEPQNYNIDWEDMRYDNPYSLEAVTKEEELIGRSKVLERIIGTLITSPVGSLYIFGQKRVGKTSLAQVALNQMENNINTICIYGDIGIIADTNPVSTINKIIKHVIENLQKEIPEIQKMIIELDGSLLPLHNILKWSTQLGKRIIIA